MQYIVNSDKVEAIEKVRPRYRLELALKNHPGDIATDFTFQLLNGQRKRLSSVSSEYIILFFNSPDCHDCARVKKMLSNVADPRVKIVSIYPDEDMELWRKAKYPLNWINGRSLQLRDEQIYDLKAIPTLYLLDRNKCVVLKDAMVEVIIQYLQDSNQ